MADGKARETERFVVSEPQMRLICVAVEHGFRACEKGKNLQAVLLGLRDLYVVEGA